jgi:hypothetical protein
MGDAAHGTAEALERAIAGLWDAIGGASPGWLALAVILHLGNQLARGRGWFAILGTAGCRAPGLRRRDAMAVWVAGAGVGGVLSARGGDAARLLLIRRRVPDAGYPVLAGTLVAEAAGEAIFGLVLAALVLGGGVGAGIGFEKETIAVAGVVGVVALPGGMVLRSRSSRLRRLLCGLTQGCAALGHPGVYARKVLPWQFTSRLLRAGSLLAFLAAFHLPVTLAAAGLVMVAQGGGRTLPFAPASLAAGVAVLAAGFPQATGNDVGVGVLAAFMVGMSTLLTMVGIVLAAIVAIWMLGAGRAVEVLRTRLRPAPTDLALSRDPL